MVISKLILNCNDQENDNGERITRWSKPLSLLNILVSF